MMFAGLRSRVNYALLVSSGETGTQSTGDLDCLFARQVTDSP
jgi:hypothetical protein